MKISKNFVLRNVMDEIVIVPVGETALEFNGIISTNKTGAFLWNLLQSDVSEDDLIQQLCAEYGISSDDARTDVRMFLSELTTHGILDTI